MLSQCAPTRAFPPTREGRVLRVGLCWPVLQSCASRSLSSASLAWFVKYSKPLLGPWQQYLRAVCAVLTVLVVRLGNRVPAKGRQRLLTSCAFASLSTSATRFSDLQRISTADTGASQSPEASGDPLGLSGPSSKLGCAAVSIRTEPKPSSPGQLTEPVTEGPGYGTRAVGMGFWAVEDGIFRPDKWDWRDGDLLRSLGPESTVVGCRIRSAEAFGEHERGDNAALVVVPCVCSMAFSFLLAADAPDGCA